MYETLASDFVLFLLSKNALRATINAMAIGNEDAMDIPINDCKTLMQAHTIEVLKSWSLHHPNNNKKIINNAKSLLCAGFGWGIQAEMWDRLNRDWKDFLNKQQFTFASCGPDIKSCCRSIW